MKYEVGDKVRVKSLQWFNENFDDDHNIVFADGWYFTEHMSIFCGKELEIERFSHATNPPHYIMKGNTFGWTDEMIEGLAEEPVLSAPNITEGVYIHEKDMKWTTEYILPDGYIFKDENGNVINATKIVLEKLVVPKFKKGDKIKDKNNRVWYVVQVGNKHFDISRIPDGSGYFVPMEDQDDYELFPDRELPKTYEECCEIMNVIMETEIVADAYSERLDDYELNLDIKIENLRKLLICRDAYWKIAGEEMGLGRPWEPNWHINEQRQCIGCSSGEIIKTYSRVINYILAFPTEEMRDAFKENFDPDIEFCKELL